MFTLYLNFQRFLVRDVSLLSESLTAAGTIVADDALVGRFCTVVLGGDWWPRLLHSGVPGLRIEGLVRRVARLCIVFVYDVLHPDSRSL